MGMFANKFRISNFELQISNCEFDCEFPKFEFRNSQFAISLPLCSKISKASARIGKKVLALWNKIAPVVGGRRKNGK